MIALQEVRCALHCTVRAVLHCTVHTALCRTVCCAALHCVCCVVLRRTVLRTALHCANRAALHCVEVEEAEKLALSVVRDIKARYMVRSGQFLRFFRATEIGNS